MPQLSIFASVVVAAPASPKEVTTVTIDNIFLNMLFASYLLIYILP